MEFAVIAPLTVVLSALALYGVRKGDASASWQLVVITMLSADLVATIAAPSLPWPRASGICGVVALGVAVAAVFVGAERRPSAGDWADFEDAFRRYVEAGALHGEDRP